MDNYSRLLRDHGRLYGVRGKPAGPRAVTPWAPLLFSDGKW